MRTSIILSLALMVSACATRTPDPAAGNEALYRAVMERDAALFGAVFHTCDLRVVAASVTEDFEFYHDKWGQIAASKADFVKVIRELCERQKTGADYKGRRELDMATVAVSPLRNYGALQTGVHHFFRVEQGKPDQATEVARFIHLWKNENGEWKLARVVSYDHKDVP